MADPLRKCLSMSGPAPLRADGDPHEYTAWGNRSLVRRTGTTWVKLWLSWDALQPEYEPRDRDDAFFDLTMSPGGEGWLWRLDRQVRAANDDGLGVILTLYHAHPRWATGATGDDPASERRAAQRVPRDVSEDGPWGWLVEYLCARYTGTVNALGPRAPLPGERLSARAARTGNPLGARVDALEIANEPNVLLWPQAGLARLVADMVRTASALSDRHRGPRILAPSLLDSPDPDEADDPGQRTDWRSFTEVLLDELGAFRPGRPVGWSHHNYRDVRRDPRAEESRAATVARLLRERRWPGWDGRLWLTEGGLDLGTDADDAAARRRQAISLERSFEEMRRLPEAFVWTHHTIHDLPGNPFRSGLRDAFRPGAGPGPARPALSVWEALPGAPGR